MFTCKSTLWTQRNTEQYTHNESESSTFAPYCFHLVLKHRRTRKEVKNGLAGDYDSQPWHFFAGFCLVSTAR